MTTTTRLALENARVLIVEDEYFIADDLARALGTAGAIAVGPVGTIAQADEILSSGKVDAAILDLNLRGNMAYSLAERLAAARLPLVIVSGYSGDALPESLRTLPRLEKPVSCEAIIAKLSEQLEAAD